MLHDLARTRARECHRTRFEVALEHGIDEARLERVGRLDGSARHQHLNRGVHAHQARQALRALGPRNDAEVHLRQPHLPARHGDAVVARHRELEPPAQCGAVKRHHHGHAAVLDAREQVVHVGRAARTTPGYRLQALDIRPCREGPSSALDDEGIGSRVSVGLSHGALEAADDVRREGIDGRVVDADDGHRGVTRLDVQVTGYLRRERGWCGHGLRFSHAEATVPKPLEERSPRQHLDAVWERSRLTLQRDRDSPLHAAVVGKGTQSGMP
jgi:hypothetical protein